MLLDYQLIRAVKSPLLNNQHGAFWLLGTGGREGRQCRAWLTLIHERALVLPSAGPAPWGTGMPHLPQIPVQAPPLSLAQVSIHRGRIWRVLTTGRCPCSLERCWYLWCARSTQSKYPACWRLRLVALEKGGLGLVCGDGRAESLHWLI